jgi:nicotinic acid mononucleotide adenylyltransferase
MSAVAGNHTRIGDALRRALGAREPRLEVLDGVPPAGSLGLVPGSFDPMTVAHAALAEALDVDLVLLVYSPRTLPKESSSGAVEPPLLDEVDRIGSLVAYAAGTDRVEVALCSHGRLVDQAEAAAAAFPHARLVFGVGSDKVAQILDPRWYRDPAAEIGRLFALSEIRYGVRAGSRIDHGIGAAGPWPSRLHPLDLPEEVAELSSSRVRAALRRGEDVDPLVPPAIRPFLKRGGASR